MMSNSFFKREGELVTVDAGGVRSINSKEDTSLIFLGVRWLYRRYNKSMASQWCVYTRAEGSVRDDSRCGTKLRIVMSGRRQYVS